MRPVPLNNQSFYKKSKQRKTIWGNGYFDRGFIIAKYTRFTNQINYKYKFKRTLSL